MGGDKPRPYPVESKPEDKDPLVLLVNLINGENQPAAKLAPPFRRFTPAPRRFGQYLLLSRCAALHL